MTTRRRRHWKRTGRPRPATSAASVLSGGAVADRAMRRDATFALDVCVRVCVCVWSLKRKAEAGRGRAVPFKQGSKVLGVL